ncbi:MAG: hypothetical protein U5L10_04120 [Candidatus Moranbacteria bacterium]|nr:hypothetical protein [Candidatus Moranbacteria bacterium]
MHASSEAERLLAHLKGFFEFNFQGFAFYAPKLLGMRCAFYKNFSEKNLSIVVFIPCVATKKGLIKRGDLDAILKTTKGFNRVVLKKTQLQNEWSRILFEKVNILENLVEQIDRCGRCENYLIPLTCKGGKFVSMKCFSCGRWSSTAYGTGLKTRLHKHLAKESEARA